MLGGWTSCFLIPEGNSGKSASRVLDVVVTGSCEVISIPLFIDSVAGHVR